MDRFVKSEKVGTRLPSTGRTENSQPCSCPPSAPHATGLRFLCPTILWGQFNYYFSFTGEETKSCRVVLPGNWEMTRFRTVEPLGGQKGMRLETGWSRAYCHELLAYFFPLGWSKYGKENVHEFTCPRTPAKERGWEWRSRRWETSRRFWKLESGTRSSHECSRARGAGTCLRAVSGEAARACAAAFPLTSSQRMCVDPVSVCLEVVPRVL